MLRGEPNGGHYSALGFVRVGAAEHFVSELDLAPLVAAKSATLTMAIFAKAD